MGDGRWTWNRASCAISSPWPRSGISARGGAAAYFPAAAQLCHPPAGAGRGARLLERTSRQVALTEAGKVLYREAQALLRQAEDVRVLVRRVDAGLRGRLRIGFVGSMLYRGLPALLAAMRAELPEVEHVLAELNSHDQIEAVHRGELDLASSTPTRYPKACRRRTWWRNPSSSACRPAMRWRGAAAWRWSSWPARTSCSSRAASPSYYETVLSLCVTAGFTPLVRHEVRHWLSVAALVSQGLGWRSCRPACRAAGWPARASSASSTRRARSVRRSGRPGPHAVAGKRDAAGDGAHADVAA